MSQFGLRTVCGLLVGSLCVLKKQVFVVFFLGGGGFFRVFLIASFVNPRAKASK